MQVVLWPCELAPSDQRLPDMKTGAVQSSGTTAVKEILCSLFLVSNVLSICVHFVGIQHSQFS